jgi:hypothetical protein
MNDSHCWYAMWNSDGDSRVHVLHVKICWIHGYCKTFILLSYLLLCFNFESGVCHHHVSLFKPCLQDNASVVVALHLSSTLRLLEGLQIIMVLKRNTRQITFLHVYHHSSIALIWWIIAYHAPGGEGMPDCSNILWNASKWSAPFLPLCQTPHVIVDISVLILGFVSTVLWYFTDLM